MHQVGTERNDNFIPLLSHPPSTYGGLKWSHNGIFEFFCSIFGIFYYALGRNETERQHLSSFFLGLFQPILSLNEAIMAFFNFFQFFCNFFRNFQLRFMYGRNETIIFIFSLFHPISTDFCLKWSDNSIFFYFLNYFAIFLEFSIMRQVGTERNDNFYFLPFSSSFNLWCLEMER